MNDSQTSSPGHILGPADAEYQASALPHGNAKRTRELPAEFQCTLCMMVFAHTSHLKSHMLSHTVGRPFTCNLCGKAFTRQGDWVRHRNSHFGEKKFICRGDLQQHGEWGCGRAFTRIDALGRHLRSKAGEICIKPLVAEELGWNKELREDIPAMDVKKEETFPAEKRGGNAAFPASLVAQYPGLARLSWPELAQVDEGLGEDIEQSRYFTSDGRNTSFESSRGTVLDSPFDLHLRHHGYGHGQRRADDKHHAAQDDHVVGASGALEQAATSASTMATSQLDPSKERGRERTIVPNPCVHCRSRYLRCDGLSPCLQCSTNSLECVYIRSRRGFKGPGRNGSQVQQKTATAAGIVVASCPMVNPAAVRAGGGTSDLPTSLVTTPETRYQTIPHNISNNMAVLPHGNLELLKGQVDVSETHLDHTIYIDAVSAREHKQDTVGAKLKEPEQTLGSTSTDCQAHLSPFDAVQLEEPFEQTHSVELLRSKDSEQGTETIKVADKHDQSGQQSPARTSSSTIGNTLGKASPYSVQSQDSESDSCFEEETETSFDEYGSVLSSSPSPSPFHISDLWPPKQMLMIDVLRAFWDIYNREFPRIVSRCIWSTAKGVINGATSSAPSSSSSGSNSSASGSSSTASSSSISSSSGHKRKLSIDDRPSDGGDRGPMEPIQGSMLFPKDHPVIRYACPFRKHNPRKYNMHHHQSCALGSFGSIARVKEHLYRRHMAPIQCVRCWLFFRDQENLNIHISATNICERRDGEAAEGITPSTEKRLRSRKKLSGGQTDNERWRDIYRMLFPGVTDEEIPSPFYESVQDDAAQASVSLEVPIEEFMRQEVPQFFTSRLQTEIDSMNLEQTGLLDDPARLRETFIARMSSLVSEAQDAAVEAYRQILSSYSNSQLNQLMTPEPSSSSLGSFPNPSQESSRAASNKGKDAVHTRQLPAVPPWAPELQPGDRVAADNALQDFLTTQGEGAGAQEAENADLDSRTISYSYPQLTNEGALHSFGEDHTNVEFATATQIPQQEAESNGSSLDLNWAVSDDWDVNVAIWSNNDFSG